MIKALTINNFQSHKNTQIEFDCGVNVIVGSSDQGKSAVLRALLWVLFNRPLGIDDLISHWARDAKGNIVDPMQVTLTTFDGTVVRERASTVNAYILTLDETGETKRYEAVNKDVPWDVYEFVRMNDVNVQQQHDSPFLLSLSAGEVAKYLNKIVKLDIIDNILSLAETKRKDHIKMVKVFENSAKEQEKELGTFTWIDQVKPLVDKFETVQESLLNNKKEYELLEGSLKKYEDLKVIEKACTTLVNVKGTVDTLLSQFEIVESLKKEREQLEKDYKTASTCHIRVVCYEKRIKKAEKLVTSFFKCFEDLQALKKEAAFLNRQIEQVKKLKKETKLGFEKKEVLRLIKELEAVKPDYKKLELLEIQIKKYTDQVHKIETAKDTIQEYNAKLPKKCPLCGSSMEVCND